MTPDPFKAAEALPAEELLIRISSGKNRSAQIWAERAHRGQERGKGSNIPYILHPAAVATLLAGAGADRDLVCAGWLHDVVEDTPVTLEEIGEEFGPRVQELVGAVTKDRAFKGMPLEDQARAVLAKLTPVGPAAVALKAADLCGNLTDLVLDAEIGGASHWDGTFKGADRAKRKLAHYTELSDLLQRELAAAGAYTGLRLTLRNRTEQLKALMREHGYADPIHTTLEQLGEDRFRASVLICPQGLEMWVGDEEDLPTRVGGEGEAVPHCPHHQIDLVAKRVGIVGD